jgi:hypothetical protein
MKYIINEVRRCIINFLYEKSIKDANYMVKLYNNRIKFYEEKIKDCKEKQMKYNNWIINELRELDNKLGD